MSAFKVKSIDVCLSPALMNLFPLRDRTVVVVDVLRATSCMVTALAHGVKSILPVADLDACRSMRTNGHAIAGERNGEKVEDFDFGNSPFEYMKPDIRGKVVAFTTTNGTQAIELSKPASQVVIGAFLNLTAVARHLAGGENDILILCAGWKGKVNLEDTLFAGALIEALGGEVEPECDAPLIALDLYQKTKGDLLHGLADASHVKRLHRLNIRKDIEFCLTKDVYDIVPVLKDGMLTAG